MKHDITAFMRQQDIEAFRAAARHFGVYIAVRRTNPASLEYIGKDGYVAKRLDCKAKTADQNCIVEGQVRTLAGLVVDPHRVGPAAYKPGKYDKALKEWDKFRPLLAPDMLGAGGGRAYTYMPGGKLYAVQRDASHKHYGCVMFASHSLLSGAKYIHGDYDLMAVVREDDVQSNVFVTEERLGQAHARSKEFFDVQHYVNRLIGAPMVLHGEQEHYSDDPKEDIDVFFPDGSNKAYLGGLSVQRLYQTVFQGRKLHGKQSPPTQPAGGLWQKA
jgi:hypothetical protein